MRRVSTASSPATTSPIPQPLVLLEQLLHDFTHPSAPPSAPPLAQHNRHQQTHTTATVALLARTPGGKARQAPVR